MTQETPPLAGSRAGLRAAVQGLRMFAAIRPRHRFSAKEPPPAPDYSLPASWAARPDRRNHSMLSPPGVEPGDRQAQAGADVGCGHPTVFVGRERCDVRLDDARGDEVVDEVVIPVEASIFNASCRVGAARARQ